MLSEIKNTDYIGIRPKDQSDFFDFLEASSLFEGKSYSKKAQCPNIMNIIEKK